VECLKSGLNREGRDLLVRELQALNESNDHFHMMPSDIPSDVELSTQAYRPTDTVLGYEKVLFRTDEWGRRFFPHVVAGK
jgi:hypothetical protein